MKSGKYVEGYDLFMKEDTMQMYNITDKHLSYIKSFIS